MGSNLPSRMATTQAPIKVYVPRDEAAEFRAFVAAEDKTITAVIRRMIRDYNAAQREKAAA